MESILLSFLSGAVGGSIITALFNFFSDRHIRNMNYLRLQIDKLYGPLYFLIVNSEKNLELSKEIVNAGEQAYNQVPADKKSEARLRREDNEMSSIYNLSKKYGDEAVKNNAELFKVISENYSFLDLEDITVIDSFIKNYSRQKLEYLANNRLPAQVSRFMGAISALQVNFKQEIGKKFYLKKKQLMELSLFTWFKFKKIKNK